MNKQTGGICHIPHTYYKPLNMCILNIYESRIYFLVRMVLKSPPKCKLLSSRRNAINKLRSEEYTQLQMRTQRHGRVYKVATTSMTKYI